MARRSGGRCSSGRGLTSLPHAGAARTSMSASPFQAAMQRSARRLACGYHEALPIRAVPTLQSAFACLLMIYGSIYGSIFERLLVVTAPGSDCKAETINFALNGSAFVNQATGFCVSTHARPFDIVPLLFVEPEDVSHLLLVFVGRRRLQWPMQR